MSSIRLPKFLDRSLTVAARKQKVRKNHRDPRVDRRKRLSHAGAQGLTPLWGRRFRLPTDFFLGSQGAEDANLCK
jgi:hypothetical protein